MYLKSQLVYIIEEQERLKSIASREHV